MRNASNAVAVPPNPEAVVLGVLLRHRSERSLLVDWPRDGPQLVFVDNRLDVMRAMRRLDVRVVVLPPFDEFGVPTAPLIERLSRELPDVAIVLVTLHPHGSGIALLAAVRAGARPLVSPTAESLWREIVAQIASQRERPLRRTAVELFDEVELPPMIVSLLARATEHAHRRLTVPMLAADAGCFRRTMERRLSATMPHATFTPKELIVWGRLLRASIEAHAERDSPVSIGRCAELAGFHSLASFRNAMRTLLARDNIKEIPTTRDVVALLCARLTGASR
jgi:AraC-like DNA-binding protein